MLAVFEHTRRFGIFKELLEEPDDARKIRIAMRALGPQLVERPGQTHPECRRAVGDDFPDDRLDIRERETNPVDDERPFVRFKALPARNSNERKRLTPCELY